MLLFANAYVAVLVFLPDTASADPLLGYHWHGKNIEILNDATNTGPSYAAINEWNNDTILNIFDVVASEEIYVFDNNDGPTSYCGAWARQTDGYGHLTYGRAMYNEYCGLDYNGKRGVFCQEVGHGFGLGHINQGCMGYGYKWDGVVSTRYAVWAHNIDDVWLIYTGHAN